MVTEYSSVNLSSVKRRMDQDLPTPESPMIMTLNNKAWFIFLLINTNLDPLNHELKNHRMEFDALFALLST